MGFKPFSNLADIIVERDNKARAIIEAKKSKRAALIRFTKDFNRKFRETYIKDFLNNTKIVYSRKHDYIRIIRLDSMEVREHSNFLSNRGHSTFYGSVNAYWKDRWQTDIPLGQRMFKRVLEECGIIE